MSRFRKVANGTWADERVRSLSEPAKLLWFYLLTGPEVTSLPGLIVIGRAGLAEALGWSPSKLDRHFAELTRTDEHSTPMAKADWRARVVWLPKGYKHNAPHNPNVVKAWKELWRAVPECSLKHEALLTLREFMSTLDQSFMTAFEWAVDRYDAVRRRYQVEVPDKSGGAPDIVTGLSAETNVVTNLDSSSEPSLARARTAPAPVTVPAVSKGVKGGLPASRPERVVDIGTPRATEFCHVFVETLAGAGWPRGDVREAWEIRALCDAINTHLRADGTAAGVLAEIRRAVTEWTRAYANATQFTSGWGARKFGEWLASGRKQAIAPGESRYSPPPPGSVTPPDKSRDLAPPPVPAERDRLPLETLLARQRGGATGMSAPTSPSDGGAS